MSDIKKLSRLNVTRNTRTLSLFSKLRHVMVAKGNNSETMFSLNYIQVKANRICASDGHCLCVADFPDGHNLIEGYYLPLKSTKTMIDIIRDPDFKGDFPDVDNLIAIDQGKCNSHELRCAQTDMGTLSGNYTEIVRKMNQSNTFSIDLFTKFAGLDRVEIPKDENCMLRFYGKEITAYIMPINI